MGRVETPLQFIVNLMGFWIWHDPLLLFLWLLFRPKKKRKQCFVPIYNPSVESNILVLGPHCGLMLGLFARWLCCWPAEVLWECQASILWLLTINQQCSSSACQGITPVNQPSRQNGTEIYNPSACIWTVSFLASIQRL